MKLDRAYRSRSFSVSEAEAEGSGEFQDSFPVGLRDPITPALSFPRRSIELGHRLVADYVMFVDPKGWAGKRFLF